MKPAKLGSIRPRVLLAWCLACAPAVFVGAWPALASWEGTRGVAPHGEIGKHSPPARLVEFGAGVANRRFALVRQAGVVLLLRLTLPSGTRATAYGEIPGVAALRISTDDSPCRERRARLVCEQAVEWCPFPRAEWAFRLQKLSGPRGVARLEFIVGSPPD